MRLFGVGSSPEFLPRNLHFYWRYLREIFGLEIGQLRLVIVAVAKKEKIVEWLNC